MSSEEDDQKFMLEIADRLTEERKRLGFRQEDVATTCHTSTRTVISWEAGKKIPSHQLARLISKGIDAWYVLTGERFSERFSSDFPSDSRPAIARAPDRDGGSNQEENNINSKSYIESLAAYGASDSRPIRERLSGHRIGPKNLDIKLLKLALETAEQGLETTKRTMGTAQKAALVGAIYGLYASRQEPVEKGYVLKLIKAMG